MIQLDRRGFLRCCVPRHPEGFCASTRHCDVILFQQRSNVVIMKEWKQLRARNEDTTIDSNRSWRRPETSDSPFEKAYPDPQLAVG